MRRPALPLDRRAQGRSQIYAFLADIYNNPGFAARLTPEYTQELTAAVAALECAQALPRACREAARLVHQDVLLNAAHEPANWHEKLAVERTRLTRGIGRRYGPPPPYESVYLGELLMYSHGASVEAHYREANWGERPAELADYIGVEMAFLAALAEREAAARRRQQDEEAQQLLIAQLRFLQEHLSLWAASYAEKARGFATTAFWQGVLALTAGFPKADLTLVAALAAATR